MIFPLLVILFCESWQEIHEIEQMIQQCDDNELKDMAQNDKLFAILLIPHSQREYSGLQQKLHARPRGDV